MSRFFSFDAQTSGWKYGSSAWGYSVYEGKPCPGCGSIGDLCVPGLGTIEIDGPSRWPDVMSNVGKVIGIIVSERVVTAMKQAGLKGFAEFPVEIRQVRGQARKAKIQYNYFHMEIYGRIELDYAASGLRRALVPGLRNRTGPKESGQPPQLRSEGSDLGRV